MVGIKMFRHRSLAVNFDDGPTIIAPYAVKGFHGIPKRSKYARPEIVERVVEDKIRLKPVQAKYVLSGSSFRGLGNKNEYVEVKQEEPTTPTLESLEKEFSPDELQVMESQVRWDMLKESLDRLEAEFSDKEPEESVLQKVSKRIAGWVYDQIVDGGVSTDAGIQTVLGEQGLNAVRKFRELRAGARRQVYDSVVGPLISAARSRVLRQGGGLKQMLRMFALLLGLGFIRNLSGVVQAPTGTLDFPTMTENVASGGGYVGDLAVSAANAGAAAAQAGLGSLQGYFMRRGGRRRRS